jgi:hypothetical protein
VVSRKFIEQFDELKWFEQQPSGAEAHLFGDLYGTTEAVSCYKAKGQFFKELQTRDTSSVRIIGI